MTEIKESLKRIREASAALEKNINVPETNEQYIRDLHSALEEINSNLEQLKSGVEQYQNSPIRLRK